MKKRVGTVYLVGAGPGDPGLLTIRGKECLERAEVVLCDALANPSLLRLCPNAEHLFVGKRGGAHYMPQDEITKLLIEKAHQHAHVVRLKGGDPFVFGRGGEEAEALAAAGVPFEVVPGITAGIAAPAYAGIPVTHRDAAANVTFVTGHRKAKGEGMFVDPGELPRKGTIVFYMGVKNLSIVIEQVRASGRSGDVPAAAVEWGTTSRQKAVVATVDTLEAACHEKGIASPAVIIIGEVAALREQLAWYERRPLLGLRVVVTRSETQASAFASALESLGAEVFEFPTIAIEPATLPEDPGFWTEFDWIILTSVHGVEALFREMDARRQDGRCLAGVKLCAIGAATRDALEKRFLSPDLVPGRYDAENLVQALDEQADSLEGVRVLLPRSAIAPDTLPEGLRARGAIVAEWTAYTTVCPEVCSETIDALMAFAPKLVTFTSGSTVRNFCSIIGEERLAQLRQTATFGAIGPVTAKAAQAMGLRVSVQPVQHDIPHFVDAIRAWAELP